MNKVEFDMWKKHTESNRFQWKLDPVHNGVNGNSYIFHRGGENGQFIEVDCGKATIGNYEGAIPHIGEAMFQGIYNNMYGSDNDAFLALIHKGGFTFLKEFVEVNENELF